MAIFCQTCYEATKDVAKSVYAVNTNGSCSKCGSFQVIDASVMLAASPTMISKAESEPISRSEPRRIQSNTDFVRTEDIREFLKSYKYDEVEHWWDGTYFEHHIWFLVEPSPTGPDFSLMIENRDGSQKEIHFRVAVERSDT